MRFYIDFENVNSGGLKGITQLKESDIVRIYYSNNPNVNMDTVINMTQSKAKIQFQKLSDGIKNMNLKNALDIIILNDIAQCLSICTPENGIAVISNDTGYDAALQSLSSKAGLLRSSTIAEALQNKAASGKTKNQSKASNQLDEAGISNLFKKGNALAQFSDRKQQIIQIIKETKTRHEISIKFNKIYSSDNVGKVMKALKPFIKQLPGK